MTLELTQPQRNSAPPPGAALSGARPPKHGAADRDPKRLLILALSLGYFMVLLDTTVVNVALPAIGHDLGGGLSGLQWVINGYTVTFAALLLTMGALADRFGARRVFLVGTGAFAIASAITAVAPSLGFLIGMRLVLGIAGAALLPASLAVIATGFSDPAQRARALGVWAAITGAALAAGPVVGGVLTDTLGWRSIFVLNVPVALLSILLTRSHAPETPRSPNRTIDLPGQVAAIVALGSLTFGLIESEPKGWGSPVVIGTLALAAVAALVFVLVERAHSENRKPMLPSSLFRIPTFSVGLITGTLVNFGLSGMLFILSLHFQGGRGYSALIAGLAFLPLTLPTAFNPIYTGRVVAKHGPRIPSVLGFTLMAIGALLPVAFLSNSGSLSIAATAVGLLVFGFGVSFAIPSLIAAIIGSVPKEQAGIGAGALNSARQTGAVMGVAILGAILGAASSGLAGTRIALAVMAGLLLVGALLALMYIGRREPA